MSSRGEWWESAPTNDAARAEAYEKDRKLRNQAWADQNEFCRCSEPKFFGSYLKQQLCRCGNWIR